MNEQDFRRKSTGPQRNRTFIFGKRDLDKLRNAETIYLDGTYDYISAGSTLSGLTVYTAEEFRTVNLWVIGRTVIIAAAAFALGWWL